MTGKEESGCPTKISLPGSSNERSWFQEGLKRKGALLIPPTVRDKGKKDGGMHLIVQVRKRIQIHWKGERCEDKQDKSLGGNRFRYAMGSHIVWGEVVQCVSPPSALSHL